MIIAIFVSPDGYLRRPLAWNLLVRESSEFYWHLLGRLRSRPLIEDGFRETLNRILSYLDVCRLTADTNADPVHWLSSLTKFVVDEANVLGVPLNVDRDAVCSACVTDLVVLNEVAVGPEVAPSIVVSKQNSDFATAGNFVVPHDVIGVVVADRGSIASVVDHPVALRQPEFNAPAPEQALIVAFKDAVSNQWSL